MPILETEPWNLGHLGRVRRRGHGMKAGPFQPLALCSLPSALRFLHFAFCPSHPALSPLPYALCSLPLMRFALCHILLIFNSWLKKEL
jgi:hypothetical protein